MKNFQQGMLEIAPVEVRLFGDNLDTLRNLAFRVENLLKNMEGTIYISNPLSNLKSDIRVDINKEKARNLGIPSIAIDRTVRLAIAGFDIGKMTDENGKNFPIKITKEKETPVTFDVFNNLYINSIQGNAIELNQIAKMKLESSPLLIRHFNKTRMVSVGSFVKDGYLVDNVNKSVDEKLKKIKMPDGYHYEFGGEVESREESFKGLGSIIIITNFSFHSSINIRIQNLQKHFSSIISNSTWNNRSSFITFINGQFIIVCCLHRINCSGWN